MNKLYYGDCLTVMQNKMPLASVDLIYLDPPFKSNRNYNAIYQDETGRPLPDQIEAFCDTWTLNPEHEKAIQQTPILMREAGIDDEVAEFWRLWMNALRRSNPSLLAYLSYMTQRLLQMRGLLKPTGSVYLHCDPEAGHYIKVLMDAVFGHTNFRNEIIWKRTGAHGSARKFGPIHDTILFYSASDNYKWNRIYQPYDDGYIEENYNKRDLRGNYQAISLMAADISEGDSGKEWRDIDPKKSGKGRHWAVPQKQALPDWFNEPPSYSSMNTQEKLEVLDEQGLIHWPNKTGGIPRFKRYASVTEGNPVQDIILDIPPASGSEYMDYDTQKPVALLERIIQASTDKGDVVFDPFCGCATTIEAAHKLDRKWIGIDIAIHAIKRVAKLRLQDRLKLIEGTDFVIEGEPRNMEGAQDLWERDKYHFQKWAVEKVDGFVTAKRTVDGGIDGRVYFAVPSEQSLQSMLLEVKGGANVTIADLRALHSVLEREEALMAGLITMHRVEGRKRLNFERLIGETGTLDVLGKQYPKIQILSVEEIFEGWKFNTPGAVLLGSQQNVLNLSFSDEEKPLIGAF